MKHRLWSDQPLSIDLDILENPRQEQNLWEKAVYPIGNGRLGCTAFGVPDKERIQFNQDSLWVGNEDNTGGYQPFGDVYIDMPHADWRDYRRELDIDQAIQHISYNSGGIQYHREYFASYPAQVIVLHFSADQPGSLSGGIRMGNVHDIPIESDDDELVMKGDTSDFWWWRVHMDEPGRLIAGREYASAENIDLDFEARVKCCHEGGSLKTSGETIVFENCDSLTILLAADTNYVADRERGWRGKHPHKAVFTRVNYAASRDIDDLREEHVADYQSLFERLDLNIGQSSEDYRQLTTPERMTRYKEQFAAGQQPEDRELEELFYQYARYLLISCSRPGYGALPANLQGIWLINKRPAWRCDFHTDINVQMNYWFSLASNLADCFEPFAKWVDSIREVRKAETREVLGVERGWLMRSENGIFGGSTWHFQKGDSAWLCQNLWDYYSFTLDNDYLRNLAYPIMKEIAEFWIDHLKELEDGILVAPEGRSPEHGPVGVDGVTYDQQLCWDLFNNCIEASEKLDCDEAFRKELIDKRERLLAPKIGSWGQLQEWMEDIDDPEDDHRHINHLIGLYPGRSVHPSKDKALADAARVSLKARVAHGAGHPAWSRVWKACMFARLGDSEEAVKQLQETLAMHVYDNMWAVHPPFQIDANFGYAAAVNEMLVQSHMGYIEILPALPKVWADGSVSGLRLRGGLSVSINWSSNKLEALRVSNLRSVLCQIKLAYRGCANELSLEAGETKDLSAAFFNL